MQQYRLIALISIVITFLVYSRNDSIMTYFGNVFVDLLALLDLRSNRGDLLAKKKILLLLLLNFFGETFRLVLESSNLRLVNDRHDTVYGQ